RGTMSPMILERRLRSDEAMLLCRYPISFAIAFTRCRVASLIRGLLLSARETVAGDIPSAFAISTMLFSDFFGVISYNPFAAKATLFCPKMQMGFGRSPLLPPKNVPLA